VTVNGPGAGNLVINGNATSRVFTNFGLNVTIFGFTITNGFVIDGNGGGGIRNVGRLTLSDSIVSNSFAPYIGNAPQGGGIINTPGLTLTVAGSTIKGNRTGELGEGGGIYISSGQLTVMNSTISDNSAGLANALSGTGGGIFYDGGTVTVTNSVISGNSA
jgi:hypothetical protein